MPREQIRKRGKRKPKFTQEEQADEELQPSTESTHAGPSSIHPARAAMLAGQRPPPRLDAPAEEEAQQVEWSRDLREAEFPFGVLDPDVKAYFRTVDDQIRDWQNVSSTGEEREDRQMFLNNVLAELRGNELATATDPDTAVVLERLLPSLGDWGRRVIGDSFGDQWEILLRHRFASYVVQTWLRLAADTLDREARDIFPPPKDSGSLRTMTELFTSLLTFIQPLVPTLLTHPHASPPLRLLFLICSDQELPIESKNDIIRSKKSTKYRKGHDVKTKSIIEDHSASVSRHIPQTLIDLRKRVTRALQDDISPVEWRSMGVNEVGSAAIQLLVGLEVGDGAAEGSLLDHLTEGLVSDLANGSARPKEYPASLLSFPIGSHLFEKILSVAPEPIFQELWRLYFHGKIGKLAIHPFANFVVASGVARLDADGILSVVKECKSVNGGRSLIKTARTSVLQALVARCVDVPCGSEVLQLIRSALDLPEKDAKPLVPCLMALKTCPAYQAIQAGEAVPEDEILDVDQDAEEAAAAAARLEGWKTRRQPKPRQSDLAPNMQGSLLLQGLVKLDQSPVVIDSLLAQPIEMLLKYASHPISSRLLDAILDSPAVPPRDRRRVIMAYLNDFATVAMDKSGSYVAESMWAKADGYMKEKIGKSLIPHAHELSGSQYGRFLAQRLDLHLLQRRPVEWRQKHVAMQKPHQSTVNDEAPKQGKRKPKDEIDELFSKRVKT
ncbi:armadillo-type protein, partial [Kockovaella imperatae]